MGGILSFLRTRSCPTGLGPPTTRRSLLHAENNRLGRPKKKIGGRCGAHFFWLTFLNDANSRPCSRCSGWTTTGSSQIPREGHPVPRSGFPANRLRITSRCLSFGLLCGMTRPLSTRVAGKDGTGWVGLSSHPACLALSMVQLKRAQTKGMPPVTPTTWPAI